MTATGARGSPGGWAGVIVRGRVLVLVLWVLIAALLVPRGWRIEDRLTGASRVEDTEAAAARAVLEAAFPAHRSDYAVLALPHVDPGTPDGRALLASVAEGAAGVRGVTRVRSPLTSPDTSLLGSGGRGAIVAAEFDPSAAPDSVLTGLRAATARAVAAVPAVEAGDVAWTGELPLWLDLRRFSAADARRSEVRALPLTLLILLIVFGGVVAALIPLATGVAAIALALGVGGLLAEHLTLSVSLQNIVTILGLALGVDYSLLLVRRFREALARGLGAEEAGAEAIRRSGRTLALSGTAVVTGFLGLAWVPLSELRSVALGGVLVVATAVALGITFVPALLVLFGDRVEWGRLPGRARVGRPREVWRRWALRVIRHPRAVLIGGLAALLALSWPALRLRTALPSPDVLPTVEAVRGLRALERMDRLGATMAVHVVLELPEGVDVLSDSGWAALGRLSRRLDDDPRVGGVRSLPALLPAGLGGPALASMLPDSVRGAFVGPGGRRALLSVVPAADVSAPAASGLVADLRAEAWDTVTGVPGARVHLAGTPAANLDYERVLGDALPAVILLVLAATTVALFLGFRSVLIPLKAVALNLLSVGAAFGVLVLVFQDGIGARWLGVTPAPEGVLPVIPVLVFGTVFGISMDYEVFLVARIREERWAGRDEVDAIAEGMQRTAGLITGAAAIMVVVFGAFALGDFVSTQMLGVALGTAVLVDASLVRLAVGPAILALGGRWNWWPSEPAARGGERGT